jgi:hypothetical protein
MSLSSLAEDSALRLQGSPGASPEAAASTAAAVAAQQVAAGTPAAQAQAAGVEAANTSGGTSVGGSALSQLIKYVPTETLTLYLAVQAALGAITAPEGKPISDADFRTRWIWLAILAVATGLLAMGLSYRSQKQLASNEAFKWPIVETVASVAAFLVWALSLPTSPLLNLRGYNADVWNPIVLLGGTTVIATVAYVLGKTVEWQKVLQEDSA